jgi:hypothetical protein
MGLAEGRDTNVRFREHKARQVRCGRRRDVGGVSWQKETQFSDRIDDDVSRGVEHRQQGKLRGGQVQSPSYCAASAVEMQRGQERPCECGSR